MTILETDISKCFDRISHKVMFDGVVTGQAMTRQKMKCTHCNLPFLPDDTVELHHIDGNHNNWKPKNCVALHRECHQHQEVHKDRIK